MFEPENPNEIKIGQRWEYVGSNKFCHDRERTGPCVVVKPNDSPESPESWVMRRESDGKTFYMHRSARMAGEWRRLN